MQQLERESEDLDQSFQAYLRRQQMLKQQMNDDASKIWENYSLSKAALAQIDAIDNRSNNIKAHPTNSVDNIRIDQIWNSTFNDDVNIQDVLKDLSEIKRLKSPSFDKEKSFVKKNLMSFKPQMSTMDTIIEKPLNPTIEYKEAVFATQIKTTFAEKNVPILLEKDPKANIGRCQENGVEIIKENEKTQYQKDEKINAMPSHSLDVPSSFAPLKLNGTTKSRTEIQFSEQKVQTIAQESSQERSSPKPSTSSTAVNEKNIKRMENVQKSSEHLKHFATLNNETTVQNGENSKTPETQMEFKTKFSPLKMNGSSKPTVSAELKMNQANGTEKETIATNGNGYTNGQPIAGTFTYGYSSKLAKFVSRISDSESNEAESDQISIGAQRLVKSPDDFWI